MIYNKYYISLGCNCHVKFYLLKQKHIINRPNDFFDYCGSTFSYINLLLNDVLEKKNISIKPELFTTLDGTKLPIDPIYKLTLYHDIKIKNNRLNVIDIDNVNIKYKRKLERFINLLENPPKNSIIKFIRLNEPVMKKAFKTQLEYDNACNNEFNDIYEFINILDKNYTKLKYEIFYLINESIDISHIINKYPDKLFVLKISCDNDESNFNLCENNIHKI